MTEASASDRRAPDTGSAPRRPGLLQQVLRDPLTHFVVAGAVLFAVWSSVTPEEESVPADPMRIELTEDDLRRIALVWLAQGRAVPDAGQMRQLAEQEAIQRILVREAMALGLDQDDEIINRRLAQKMDFLLADLAALEEPDEAELREWYAANLDRFAMPPRISFRHLYFAQDERGVEGARDAAADLVPKLAGLGADDQVAPGIADRFMFQDYYGGRTPGTVAREFGPDFARDLFALPAGEWQGPIRSGYGWHLVRIDSLEPERAAGFEEVEEAVSTARLEERHQKIRERAYDDMLSRYTIVMPPLEHVELDLTQTAPQGADTP